MFWPKKLIVKNLNSRIIPEKAWKSGFFPVHSQYPKKKKKYRTIHRIQRILEPLGTLKLYVWNYMHPSVILETSPSPSQ